MTVRDSRLRLTTVFDDVVLPRPLPASFRRGDDAALQLIDGFVRGRQSLGRFAVISGLVGFRVATGAHPVAVAVRLRADDVSVSYWADRVGKRQGVSGNPHAPRLVQVRSQGKVRGAVLLGRAPWTPADAPVRGVLRFELSPDELPEDGLLLIELGEAPGISSGDGRDLLPHAAVGMELTEVAVETIARTATAQPAARQCDAVTAERSGWLATGDMAPPDGVGARTVRSGVFLVDLPTSGGTVMVSLTPRGQPVGAGSGRADELDAGAGLRASAASMIDGSAVHAALAAAGPENRLTLTGQVPGAVRVHLVGAEAAYWNIVTVSRP